MSWTSPDIRLITKILLRARYSTPLSSEKYIFTVLIPLLLASRSALLQNGPDPCLWRHLCLRKHGCQCSRPLSLRHYHSLGPVNPRSLSPLLFHMFGATPCPSETRHWECAWWTFQEPSWTLYWLPTRWLTSALSSRGITPLNLVYPLSHQDRRSWRPHGNAITTGKFAEWILLFLRNFEQHNFSGHSPVHLYYTREIRNQFFVCIWHNSFEKRCVQIVCYLP